MKGLLKHYDCCNLKYRASSIHRLLYMFARFTFEDDAGHRLIVQLLEMKLLELVLAV